MKKQGHIISWGAVACLSFIVMSVAFLVPCPPVVIASGGVFFLSCIALGLRFFDRAENAFKEGSPPFDDYGYL